eukprot:UN10174
MSNKDVVICKAFGSAIGCRFGNKCRFSHNNPNSVPLCKYYTSSHGCYARNTCHWRHKSHNNFPKTNTDHIIFDDDNTIPICKFFNINGCRRSLSCRFRHIQQKYSDKNSQFTNKQIEYLVFGFIRISMSNIPIEIQYICLSFHYMKVKDYFKFMDENWITININKTNITSTVDEPTIVYGAIIIDPTNTIYTNSYEWKFKILKTHNTICHMYW